MNTSRVRGIRAGESEGKKHFNQRHFVGKRVSPTPYKRKQGKSWIPGDRTVRGWREKIKEGGRLSRGRGKREIFVGGRGGRPVVKH